MFRAHCCAPIHPSACPHAPSCWGWPQAGFLLSSRADCRATPRSSHRLSNKILLLSPSASFLNLGGMKSSERVGGDRKTNPGPRAHHVAKISLREPRAGGQATRGRVPGRFPVLGRVELCCVCLRGAGLGAGAHCYFGSFTSSRSLSLSGHLTGVQFPRAEYWSSAVNHG